MKDKQRPMRKLKHLIINRVALVDAGANQHADILLYKAASQAATNSLTVSPSTAGMKPCPVCKNDVQVGTASVPSVAGPPTRRSPHPNR